MLTLCLASLLFAGHSHIPTAARTDTTYRWFLLSTDLKHPGEPDKTIKTIDAAAAAGYNGVIFEDPTFQSVAKVPATFLAALTQVMGEAKKTGVEFVPSVAPIGSAAALLQNNPSLAESMPYKNVHFTVTGGKLKPSDSLPTITNGGFETFAADLPTGFKAAGHPGVAAFMDKDVKHAGAASLRVEGQTAIQPGNKVMYEQSIVVLPWHQYRLSIWTKSVTSAGSIVNLVPLGAASQVLGYYSWQYTPDWAKSIIVFNSQDNTSVNLQLTVQPVAGAKIWFDDLGIEDVGLLNVTRRDDCPITIRGDDGAIFNEYVDIDEIKDTFIPPGTTIPALDIAHDPVQPAVLGNSRLHESQVVVLDYYAAILVDNKPTLCFNERQARTLLKAEIRRVIAITHPHSVFFNIDKVKALGWDPGCDATQHTPGENLAKFIQDEAATVKSIDPTIQIVTYGNMFDPSENSKDAYFFTKGGTSGSAKGLPKNTVILNENYANGTESLGYFARLGYQQILLGFFDNAAGVPPIDQWEKISNGITGIKGFGYVSLTNDFSHLVDFAHAATAVH